jgi:hypothetical protein
VTGQAPKDPFEVQVLHADRALEEPLLVALLLRQLGHDVHKENENFGTGVKSAKCSDLFASMPRSKKSIIA